MGNIGNLLYVLIAFIGGAVAINQWAPLSLGAIGSFLQLSRQFSMPIAQISQQLNSIVMALAGAERIFNLEDQASEPDDGTVTISKGDEVGSNWNWNVPQKMAQLRRFQFAVILSLITLTSVMCQNTKFYTTFQLMLSQAWR